MLRCPARVVPTRDGQVRVILPDVPEVEVVAASEEAALARAPEALESALSGYVVAARSIPSPSDICGAPMIEIQIQPSRPGGGGLSPLHPMIPPLYTSQG